MKLVAVARVKNELDIIEAFVRHHVQHFDKLIVLDDGSSDGTYEVLQQLQSVYRGFVILRQPTIGYMQDQYMTLLLRMAVDKFGADWVAPLDADEFIEPADGLVLSQVLSEKPAVYGVGWCNFLWTPELEQSEERNPVLRQRFRLPLRLDQTKLLIHSQFVSGTATLSLGNHVLMDGGLAVPTQPLDRVRLCHYPVRRVGQYAGKVAVGYLQYLATPDWHRGNGFHYIEPFQDLAKCGLHGIRKRMSQDSLFYSIDESERAKDNPQAVEAPLNYLGGPLTLTSPERSPLVNVLRHAEMMASEFAVKAKRSQDVDRVSTENAALRKRVSELELQLLSSQEKAAQQGRQFSELELELLNSRANAAQQAQQLSELELECLSSQQKAAQQARQLSDLEIERLMLLEKLAQQARQLQSRTFRALTRMHGILIRARILRQRV